MGSTRRVVRGFAVACLLLSGLALAPASATTEGAGRSQTLAPPEDPVPNVPPFIDALDGIVRNGSSWDPDPVNWPHAAPIAVRNSSFGETEAQIKLRIEGKGDPIKQYLTQQTVMVLDDSGSMSWNDPNNMRCTALQTYADQLTSPDELGLAKFADVSTLVSQLTTNYGSVKSAVQCTSSGASGVINGLQTALDELIPKKKATFTWAALLTMDNWNTGGDPQVQVDRATANGVRVYPLGFWPDASSSDKQFHEPEMIRWANQTGGKYY